MGIKRKACDEDSPLFTSSWGSIPTPEEQSPTPFSDSFTSSIQNGLDAPLRVAAWDFMSAGRTKGNDWGNRTRKRFRDNRPHEREIHANTLNKLFAAQRNLPDASPIPSETLHLPLMPISKPQKSTLHSFWTLPTPPVQKPLFTTLVSAFAQGPRCEDCDAWLQSDDSVDVDMDMDMVGSVESHSFACNDCGKKACATCAIVATRRHRLQCTVSGRNSRRRWW